MSETRKLAAILVADVVGYGRLAGADEDGRAIRPNPKFNWADDRGVEA